MAEIVAESAVGLALSLMQTSIDKTVTKTRQFKPQLEDLQRRLNYLKPFADKIKDDSKMSYVVDQLKEGTNLIDKLSKVGTWNILKSHYSSKLAELDVSICKMLLLLIPQVLMEVKDIKAETGMIERELKRIELRFSDENIQSGGIRATADLPPSSPVGLDRSLSDVKEKLLNDVHQVSMLSITAPGGSGKTTLAQMVCDDQEVKAKFNNMIFFATVSRKPDLVELQNSVKMFLDETNAALLVLDDVWKNSSLNLLEELHELSQGSSYKILVTSRYSSKYGVNFPLAPLTTHEALTLLKNSTSMDYSSGDLDELMEQIVKYCKRFPLAIKVIGKSLFKESIEMWKEKVDNWSKVPILEEHIVLRDCLQPSLDVLCEYASENGDIIKECFIDLASLPEDGMIPVGLLTDMWTELYSLSENGSIVKVQQLNHHNLAKLLFRRKENENVDSCYSEHFVRQHDMLRELALHQIREDPEGKSKRLNIDICGDDLPEQLTRNKLQETRLLSITTDGDFPSKWDRVHLPEAVVMVLNFQTDDYTLPPKIPQKVKVLIVRNNGSSSAKISNLKLMSTLPALKRVRLERISISSEVLKKKKEMKSLEKISLFMCDIAQPASTSSIRFFKAMPNLVEINIEYCNNLKQLPADLFGLKYLKKLIITNCHNLSSLPEDIRNLINLEVLRLRCCADLETLPDSITSLNNLIYLDISDCFSIKKLPENIGDLSKLKKLNMRKCERLKGLPPTTVHLNTLQEVICDEEIEELWKPMKIVMENLRITVVKEEFNLDWLLGHH